MKTIVALLFCLVCGQTTTDPSAGADAEENELKATEIGVRFTPELSAAMSKKFMEQMKPRYELSDEQAKEMTEIMTRRFLKFARENSENGRDMIELMMSNMLEHDGHFDQEAGKKFAELSKPLTANMKQFFTDSAGEIGKKMTMKQKLMFTADVGIAATGLLVFENRMNRWSEGKLGSQANPFFDPEENDKDAAKTPPDPNESVEHRNVRTQVERWVTSQTQLDDNWDNYVKRAIDYYKFDEKQTTAARAILKECKERAKPIKTPEWKAAVKENRILEQLTWKSKRGLAEGPFHYQAEAEFKRLMQPMNDLADELKRRIESIPTSAQRAAARAKAMEEMTFKAAK